MNGVAAEQQPQRRFIETLDVDNDSRRLYGTTRFLVKSAIVPE